MSTGYSYMNMSTKIKIFQNNKCQGQADYLAFTGS